MKNRNCEVIYNYLVNEVDDKDINELVMYLRDYTINGSFQDGEITTTDVNDLCVDLVRYHTFVSKDSIQNLIYDLEKVQDLV